MSQIDKIDKIDKIEAQVERWDLYARLVPTAFLIISLFLVSFKIIDFETAFWLGLSLFAMTAVTWWFWTIYTIRKLVRSLSRASYKLKEVKIEFLHLAKDIQDLKNGK